MAASRFAAPVTDEAEEELRKGAVPTKTRCATEWGVRVWSQWASNRQPLVSAGHVPVSTPILQMPVDDFAYWVGKFVLEVRKQDSTEYPPKTLYAVAGH